MVANLLTNSKKLSMTLSACLQIYIKIPIGILMLIKRNINMLSLIFHGQIVPRLLWFLNSLTSEIC